jgi:hypothetical protein
MNVLKRKILRLFLEDLEVLEVVRLWEIGKLVIAFSMLLLNLRLIRPVKKVFIFIKRIGKWKMPLLIKEEFMLIFLKAQENYGQNIWNAWKKINYSKWMNNHNSKISQEKIIKNIVWSMNRKIINKIIKNKYKKYKKNI